MRKILLTGISLFAINLSINAQCKEIKKSLKVLNEDLLDSSIALLNKAEVIIKENGVETVDGKCLAKYYYTRGITQLMLGKKEDSVRLKEQLLKSSGDNYLLFLKQAERPSELEENVQSNLVSLAVEYGNLGVLNYQQGAFNRAFSFVEKGMELKRTFGKEDISEQDYFNALVCAKVVGSNDKALEYSDSLLSNSSLSKAKRIKYLCQRAEVFLNLKNADSAKVVIDQARALDSTDLTVRKVNLQYLLTKDDYQRALTELEILSKNEEQRVQLLVLKGQILHKLERDSLSQIAFVEALALDSKNSGALYGLGALAVSHANRYVTAGSQLQGLEKLKNDSLAQEKFLQAVEQFEKIPASDEKYLEALTAMKAVYESLGDQAKIEEVLDRISKL